jgi:hypothetical protein
MFKTAHGATCINSHGGGLLGAAGFAVKIKMRGLGKMAGCGGFGKKGWLGFWV